MSSQYLQSGTSHMFQESLECQLTDEELVQLVFKKKQQIKIFTLENEILEKTIMNLDPSLMPAVLHALELTNRFLSSPSVLVMSGSKLHGDLNSSKITLTNMTSPSVTRFMCPSRISTKVSLRKVDSSGKLCSIALGSGPKINLQERTELVHSEMSGLTENLKRHKRKSAKKIELLKSQIEEIDIREAHIERVGKMFHEDVTIKGLNKIAQRIPAEVWIRFMTNRIRVLDLHIEKMRLRTSTLIDQYSKLRGVIREKAELSKKLKPIDFDKLAIENSNCEEIIERKLIALGELKKMTVEGHMNLSKHNNALMAQDSYLTSVQNAIKQRDRQTKQLDNEREELEEHVNSLAEELNNIRKIRSTLQAPRVIDYVHVKSEIADLKRSIKTLESSLKIKQFGLKSIRKKVPSCQF